MNSVPEHLFWTKLSEMCLAEMGYYMNELYRNELFIMRTAITFGVHIRDMITTRTY